MTENQEASVTETEVKTETVETPADKQRSFAERTKEIMDRLNYENQKFTELSYNFVKNFLFDEYHNSEIYTQLLNNLDEVGQLELMIARTRNRIKVINRQIWLVPLGLVITVIVGGVVWALISTSTLFTETMLQQLLLLIIVLAALVFIILAIFAVYKIFRKITFTNEIELIRTKLRVNRQLNQNPTLHGEQVSYFDTLVSINVENLAEYYSLVKIHTNNSFRASLLSGLIGFTFIITGLFIALTNGDNAIIGIISTATGVIINFISGIFFYLYNRTVRQLKGYHDSLLDVQNILLAFKIVGDLQDETQRATTATSMIEALINKQRST